MKKSPGNHSPTTVRFRFLFPALRAREGLCATETKLGDSSQKEIAQKAHFL